MKRKTLHYKKTALVIIPLIFIGGHYLAIGLMKFRASSEFKNCHLKNNQDHVKPVISVEEWPLYFGGLIGREALVSFSKDDEITDEGHRQAELAVRSIDDGRFRTELQRSISDTEHFRWESRLLRYWLFLQQ